MTRGIAVCVLALGVATCGDDAGGPRAGTVPVASGTYAGVVQQGSLNGFPQAGGSDFEMTVERAAGTVEIRYVKANVVVVEYWKIVE